MALTGVHISFSTIATPTPAGQLLPDSANILSQSMNTAGTSSIAAPSGAQLLSISASAPIFYSVGTNPDVSGTSTTRRYFDPSSGREDMFVHIGDRVAWGFA